MYRLHFSELNQKGDIPCFEFKKHIQMVDFIDSKGIDKYGQQVYFLAKDDNKDIFISESYISIQDFLLKKSLFQTVGDYFLFECESYVEAYKLAMLMKEGSDLIHGKN